MARKSNWWTKLVKEHHKKGMTLIQAVKSAKKSAEYKNQKKAITFLSRKRRKYFPPRTRRTRRTGVKMPRRRRYTRKRRRSSPRTIPILPLAGIGAAVVEPVRRMVSGDIEGGLIELSQRATGVSTVDGTFHPEWLKSFWIPIVAGAIGHKLANIIGINRVFSKLPSPLNKLRL